MSRVPLYQELRLIERNESEVNGAWKGAHVLLFFLAFVFGSFCTFCFHMLMYLFDEKCVLFPKLLSLPSIKHNVIYEFVPSTNDLGILPIDLLSPQWVEKSTCSLPTFVPLVSGICGLIWTTLFLMCSTGRRLTGLQRPWRVIPPMFVFSLVMSCVCIYSSVVTHYGLHELCTKLGEITGSPTCSYTINVATLLYERRIRGVYQATRLTILSAWLHTACWLLSAVLALVRVLLAVDFKLVRVSAQLHGDIDNILQRHEVQIRTISPETLVNEENERTRASSNDFIFLAKHEVTMSDQSLVPDKRYEALDEDTAFIVKMLYDLLKTLPLTDLSILRPTSMAPFSEPNLMASDIFRQYGTEVLKSRVNTSELQSGSRTSEPVLEDDDVKEVVERIDSLILSQHDKVKKSREGISFRNESPRASTSRRSRIGDESVMNITPEMRRVLDTAEDVKLKNQARLSSLRTISVQTDDKGRTRPRVQISQMNVTMRESDSSDSGADQRSAESLKKEVDKDTQTREKEKQD
ncbi:uncharacterized protein LOC110383647 isoform X1 [Helicoverpa armigera]|uniref:uncharacterized protein LOC110383647 isoform X1 n=2 Tax=Helicoverpa armigera TaxID=29058 RepID=UPI0030831D2B